MAHKMPIKNRGRHPPSSKVSKNLKHLSMSTNGTDHIQQETQLKILQYNVHKSREITDSILNNPAMEHFIVLLVQEQHNNKITKSPPNTPVMDHRTYQETRMKSEDGYLHQ